MGKRRRIERPPFLAPTDSLLKTGEAARLLNVSRRTIERMVEDGRLYVVRIPTRAAVRPLIRIPRSSITKYLQGEKP